jgi:hypothetical protein
MTFFFPSKMGMTWAVLDVGWWWKKKYMMGLFSFFAINFLSFVPFQKEKENMHNSLRKKKLNPKIDV